MVAYVVEEIAPVTLIGCPELAGMDLMSPFVWSSRQGGYAVMVRAVPNPLGPDDPTGIIYAGHSADGLAFTMDPTPVITPGPDPFDIGGVEDPTVLEGADGLTIYYTGVEATRRQGVMLVATGADPAHLVKRQLVLKAPEGEGNIKEATLAQTDTGGWRLFYEYARDNASRIGMARENDQSGNWTVIDDPFGIRTDGWDNWHLSTGPIVQVAGHDPVMFYNGATADARWRIGWVSFSPDYTRITGRGLEPILVPPPDVDRLSIDIAFAASAIVEAGGISLWYSLDDRMLMRARVKVYD